MFATGNKDFIVFHFMEYNSEPVVVGHIVLLDSDDETCTLTASVTSGFDKTVTVDDTSYMKLGKIYYWMGISEGHFWTPVTINSITNSTTMIVSYVPTNLDVGGVLSRYPGLAMRYVLNGSIYNMFLNCRGVESIYGGLTGQSGSCVGFSAGLIASSYFDGGYLYSLSPVIVGEGIDTNKFKGIHPGILGFYSDIIVYGYQWEGGTYMTNPQYISSIITSIGSNTLTDSLKNWTTNELSNKYVLITGGNGSGIFNKIVSNTSNTITLSANWNRSNRFTPSPYSQYAICDGGYITINCSNDIYYAAKVDTAGSISVTSEI